VSKKALLKLPLNVQISFAHIISQKETEEKLERLHNALFEGAVGYLRSKGNLNKKVAKKAVYAKIQAY
jgi:hypothetical protein